jgi:hypothetical protein
MQRDLNDIKTLFDDFLVNLHLITSYQFIHQDPTEQNGTCEERTYVVMAFPSHSGDLHPRQNGLTALNASYHGSRL